MPTRRLADRPVPFHERFRDRISMVTRTGAHIRIRSEGASQPGDAGPARPPGSPPTPAPPPQPDPRAWRTVPDNRRRRRQSESAPPPPPPEPKPAARPRYKPYSLRDYRQLPGRVVLGRLGPDLDSDALAAKRLASYRMQEFSQARRVINQTNLRQARDRAAARRRIPPPPPPQTATSSRQRALQFAAKLAPPGPGRKPEAAGGGGRTPGAVLDEIEQLTREHERRKTQVDAIRREMRLMEIDGRAASNR